METGDSERLDIQLHAPHGPVARLIFAALGAAVIALVLHDLGRALWPVGWWSVFFAVVVFGSCSVGTVFLMASVFGEDVRWTLRAREMRVERQSLFRKRIDIVRPGEVTGTEIKPHEWDSRPDSFSVVIHLRSGRKLDTPDVGSRERAEALEAEIRARLC